MKKMTELEKVTAQVAKQIEFVKWLSSKGMYNEYESAATMQKMQNVWTEMKDKNPEIKFDKEITNGDVMTIDKFIEYCFDGCFNDLDGYGVLSDGKKQSSQTVSPSEVVEPGYKISSTHVVWFNK